MLEAFSINSIYHAISFVSLPVMIIALFVGWKSINTRCLLLMLVALELMDTIFTEIAISWGNYYYLCVFIISWAYVYVVFARRLIVAKLKSRSRLCKDVYDHFYFTRQEGALLFVYISYVFVTFIALVELGLFVLYVIDSFPYIRYLFSPLLTFFCLMEAIVILWLATRTAPVDEHVLAMKHARKMRRNNHSDRHK
ncbi:hypothetical protein [Pseudoalteromonas luteoviolacea]|nr:hypothetical protein [Pseudoalteromonas luteoviolacea]